MMKTLYALCFLLCSITCSYSQQDSITQAAQNYLHHFRTEVCPLGSDSIAYVTDSVQTYRLAFLFSTTVYFKQAGPPTVYEQPAIPLQPCIVRVHNLHTLSPSVVRWKGVGSPTTSCTQPEYTMGFDKLYFEYPDREPELWKKHIVLVSYDKGKYLIVIPTDVYGAIDGSPMVYFLERAK